MLTISDMSEFTAKGGVVKLFIEENKIRFQVNARAAKTSKFVMSSRLLRLADICCEDDN